MAFVVVQHLSHNQESILHEIIQRHSKMKVQPIADDTDIQPDQVYVLPAGYDVTIEGYQLHLKPMPATEGWPETITLFFESLAQERHEHAVAIILSGAGHDGTEGARVVIDNGGLVIAQDLESAVQSSMPFNVIDAGLAAVVLSPDLMPSYLMSHFQVDLPVVAQVDDFTESITDADLKRVLRQLRHQSGYNFSEYKVSTVRRQIARRMGTHQLHRVNDYLALMEQQVSETEQLVKGLLITVTSFFRDPDAFEALKTDALLPLLKSLSIDDIFRVWVPGCASGEEAVSIAIIIYECLRDLQMTEMEVRIFATDINRDLIQRARLGTYHAVIEGVSPARLKDHFMQTDDGYTVRAHISRMIVWAEHNLVEHPPFSGLHLISCRNVLIYFQPKLQERVRTLFHFALRSGGILFLGTSEAMPELLDLFTTVNSKQKIYQRTSGASYHWMKLDRPLFSKAQVQLEETPMTAKLSQPSGDNHNLRVIKESLLTHYSSTCVIVDERYIVRYSYGEIDQYLRLVPGGEAQNNVLSMAREGLESELTIALYEAFDSDKAVTRQGVWLKTNGVERQVNLIVLPIHDTALGSRYRLVIFEPATGDNALEAPTGEKTTSRNGATITRLRGEIQQARQALQSATQALQAKNEELTSSMEEIGSANEEIQTTNEELRTSKEELESMNEELNTLNTQLSNQNSELTHANNALYNFLQSTAIGVIFLDQNLAIREYTQAVTSIFSLRKSDIGRPLAEITSQLQYESLIGDATTVLDTLVNVERKVASTEERWYKVEIRPYRTMNNIIDGLVLTFIDITIQHQAQEQALKTSQYLRKVIDTVDNSLLELDSSLRVVAANAAFYEQFHVKPDDTIGRLIYDLGNGQWDIPDLRRLLNEIIPRQSFVRDYTVTHEFPQLGKRTMRLTAEQIKDIDGILLVITELFEPDAPTD
jgi:two-component system, chemotaxis family, CheB/CheR fusion protein